MRNTFAMIDELTYRLRAASALIGVTDNTMRNYADNAGIEIKRASDLQPGQPPVRVFSPDKLFQLAQWRRLQGYVKSPAAAGRPFVITVDIVKGGTAKTTSAVELAVHLQFLGLRALLIDLDVQANATQMMGFEPDLTIQEAASYELSAEAIVEDTLASVLLPYIERNRGNAGRRLDPPSPLKMPFGASGPHLMPADTFLGDIEHAIANAKGQRELYLRHLLAAASAGDVPGFDARNYDVVIFDCPPSVSFTSSAALAAADLVVAPIRMDAFSVKGLTRLMTEIDSISEAYKVRPELVILPTHYASKPARIGRMQAQLNQYREMLAPCTISASEEFPKSLDSYLPLSLQKPTCSASKEYRAFAEFVHTKVIHSTHGKEMTQ